MGVIALVVGLVLLASGAVFLAGIYAQRRLRKTAPESRHLRELTPVGLAWFGCFVLYLLMLPGTYYLAPESAAASLLGRWWAWPLALFAGVAVFSAGGAALACLGYPLYKPAARDAT
jgi:hypothetical protein